MQRPAFFPEQFRVGDNLLQVVRAVTPPWPRDSHHKTLRDLWRFYDEPYGHEVELRVRGVNRTLVLVPYLSSLCLQWTETSSRKHSLSSPRSAASGISTSSSSQSESEEIFEVEVQKGEGKRRNFTLFMEGPPYWRVPMGEHMKELGEKNPQLWNMPLSSFDPRASWFSVSWHPVVVSGHDHATGIFRGYFLTYHGIEPLPTPWPAVKHFPPPVMTPRGCSISAQSWEENPVEEENWIAMVGFVSFETTFDTWYEFQDEKKRITSPSILQSYESVLRLLSRTKAIHHDFNYMVSSSRIVNRLIKSANFNIYKSKFSHNNYMESKRHSNKGYVYFGRGYGYRGRRGGWFKKGRGRGGRKYIKDRR